MPPTPVATDELDAVVRLIAAEQARPERNVAFLGDESEAGIRAELDALSPPWGDTVRVVRAGAAIVGVSLVEWDDAVGRAWIFGPWVTGDDDLWTAHANSLLDAGLKQIPDGVHEAEVSAELANTRLIALAEARGWKPSNVQHVMTTSAGVIAASAPVDSSRVRLATPADVDAIRPLHDGEFPNTHTSADVLPEKLTTLVASDEHGAVVGYIAGQVHPDGEGYIDYIVVDDSARRTGRLHQERHPRPGLAWP